MTTATAFTVRDKIKAHEQQTPNHVATAVEYYHRELKANNRVQPHGHRTEVTPYRLISHLDALLDGGFGLGAQIVAFRRVQNIKAVTPSAWRNATRDVLADLAQLIDDKLERSRAERIAADATKECIPVIRNWLGTEAS